MSDVSVCYGCRGVQPHGTQYIINSPVIVFTCHSPQLCDLISRLDILYERVRHCTLAALLFYAYFVIAQLHFYM